VRALRKQVEIEGAKVEKYKHISYLATSIERNTDAVKIVNSRSYKQMLKQQEDTLANLKQFKTSLRKENEDLENKLLQSQVAQQPKKPPPERASGFEGGNAKVDRKFMATLEELIQLLMRKEEGFEEMKAEQTTKVRLRKVQKGYLKEERVKMHEMIERFEEKYDVKVESLANLIIHVHQRLSSECEDMENECIKRNQIKQLLSDDLLALGRKEGALERGPPAREREETGEEQAKRSRIFRNSQILTRVAMLFHNLIGKFRYLFTMAITLSKEKKNFHDLLVQIGNMYNPAHILLEHRGDDPAALLASLTNFQETEALLAQHCGLAEEGRQLLGFIFNDLRYALIFRRQWLEEELRDSPSALLDKVQSIQSRCDEVYDSKVKVYSLLLINCLKALSMNKYERKMVTSSKAKDSLFLSIPKAVKIINLEEGEEEPETPSERDFKLTQVKFSTEENEKRGAEGIELAADPRRIVQLLERVKNEEKMSFVPLSFNSDNLYLYDRKVVIPKYVYQ
jgi:hypothetical protein